ncbi:MFS transporter [Amycolatopsis rubida]|uniref:MFS transporter n=1 Tax=Amycolatopsis rubida TaxID=112413 RepID=A0ABX0BK54_9PSEU|nr:MULTISPECIES: MFS transporter [Amycolatopsis]MYW90926.1 MFS transporter [Amycolatopsis rubida]NEC55911.1 MFS transporter [Amycolatopsis rubida]OAP26006.1 multidrug resistance protein D [Amycolatopsis sp. M39]
MSIAVREKRPEEDVRVWLVLAPLMLGALTYGVLGAVVVPALPLLQRDLHTNENGATWLLTAYFLAAAAATAVVGRLGDMVGKRRMLLIVLSVMAAGQLVCATADSLAPESPDVRCRGSRAGSSRWRSGSSGTSSRASASRRASAR